MKAGACVVWNFHQHQGRKHSDFLVSLLSGRAESCQQSNIRNGIRLNCVILTFYLGNSHILGTDMFLWDIVKLNHLMKTKCVQTIRLQHL